MPLIGCGGVEDAETALAKIEAGANLVQLYTGLALKGHGRRRGDPRGLEPCGRGPRVEPDRRTGRRPGDLLGRARADGCRRGGLRGLSRFALVRFAFRRNGSAAYANN